MAKKRILNKEHCPKPKVNNRKSQFYNPFKGDTSEFHEGQTGIMYGFSSK